MADAGLDETSCFFADDDGVQVEHGHLYEGVQVEADGNISTALRNPSFHFDMSRRKVLRGAVGRQLRIRMIEAYGGYV